MAHTLTFSGYVSVSVDGQSVTSPYTLTKSCTIRITNTKDTDFGIVINGTQYVFGTSTIDLADSDIVISDKLGATGSEVTVIINYSETTPRPSVDVSTLPGWANLSAGEHNITVVAKANGFKDSAPSAAVKVTKAPAMPVKGDIITMDSRQYRVLKTSGKIAEVLCMYDANSSIRFDANSDYNNTYAGKNIDTYCNNTFYSGLSAAMKSAIVDKTFTQDSWARASSVPTQSHYTGKYGSSTYYLPLANAAFGTSITRHCYCLSVQDVLDYLEATTSMGTSDTTLTDTNVWKMFWNVTTSQSDKYIWLRSAYTSGTYAFTVVGYYGTLDYLLLRNSCAARPAFQIDLSKISWSK